ncbi:SPX domain-containing protein 1 [Glycine soja]|nr:SPX domain-containing protein 1 [Glycine max]
MKFWKILKSQIEQTLPEWRDQFLSYKDLKKQLKVMCPKDALTPPRLDADELNHFLRLLELEIDKFNAFFVDKEEEYIIKWKELQDRVARAIGSNLELMSLGRGIVDFHGEMIIKKYDKRTGALLRLPFIQEVLNQPFFKIDVLNKLVKECEVILSILFNNDWPSISGDFEEDEYGSTTGNESKATLMHVPKELAEIENMENTFTKLTLSALRSLEEIRGRSSTVSIFSLPPLHN